MFSKVLFASLIVGVLSVNAFAIPFARSPVEASDLDTTWSRREPGSDMTDAYTFFGREPEPEDEDYTVFGREPEPEDEGYAVFEREPEPEDEDYTFFGREPEPEPARGSSYTTGLTNIVDLATSTLNLANVASMPRYR